MWLKTGFCSFPLGRISTIHSHYSYPKKVLEQNMTQFKETYIEILFLKCAIDIQYHRKPGRVF